MPPHQDDPGLADDSYVLRALPETWVTTKGGRRRPSSNSFLDSNFENSCFLESEISLDEVRLLTGQAKIARVPIRVLRAAGYWLERRADEAPLGCTHPDSHLVCGPPQQIDRGRYEKAARSIVKSPDVEML
jgi:hypothetical protein